MEENLNLVRKAKEDVQAKEELIRMYEDTIIRIASKTANRYITKSDDDYSIALLAFSKAVDTYEENKGPFNAYIGLLIQRSLIDYYRKENIYNKSEVTLSQEIIEAKADEGMGGIVEEEHHTNNVLKEEILRANEMLGAYGFRFFDLTACSPKQEKTKDECAQVIGYMLKDKSNVDKLRLSHQLPLKEIHNDTKVSLKLLDRYRRYIIMAVLILSDDYPYLSNYLKDVERRIKA